MPSYSSINLHPSTHPISSLKTHTFDVICIGSGWAGRVTAARVVKTGLTALIIEQELVGGDCPFWACVPSKAILRPNEALEAARAVTGVGEKVAEGGVVVESVWKRRDDFTGMFDDTKLLVPMVENSGVTLVRGKGKLVGVKKVSVVALDGSEVELEARVAVAICTGSEPAIPDPLKAVNPWTPREATSSSTVPEHLVIVGAGAVGTEMATAYSSFGSKVTLISSTKEILPKIDEEGAKLVRESLTSKGVNVILATKVTDAAREADNSVKVTLSNGSTFSANEILVAAGRRAQTANIGLESFGLKGDGSFLPVEESLRVTSVPGKWLYAGGDVNGRAPLTHSSKYHGRIISNAISADFNNSPTSTTEWSRVTATADRLATPAVIFTDPAVASVGLTRKAAQKAGIKFKEINAPVATLGAMLHAEGYAAGWAQWIVDQQSNKLLGATFVGKEVADLLHASTVAVVGGMTLEQLSHAIPSFPTTSEVYLDLLDAAGL
ncbi:dihydrolipoamide dehydrogenase [Mollisia scopiformis]|uniref:Dihydrolipoamide dehydrogenase n=1 Tax=Mollisia scopiformis TaxID=149040 RepID=A0A194XMK1_MOLSC|nr:dihydrolipoamide dehydrogenase [Mollisia scopiformis]KUJ21388.1 dihydrolipoamide dehydrogenase [Mollisia scopiformis]